MYTLLGGGGHTLRGGSGAVQEEAGGSRCNIYIYIYITGGGGVHTLRGGSGGVLPFLKTAQ